MESKKTISGPYSTVDEVFEKLMEELREVRKSPNSARHLVNFSMTAFHLTEWVWHLVPGLADGQGLTGKRGDDARREYFKTNWGVDFALMAGLANGSKHCVLSNPKKSVNTGERGGAFSTGFSSAFDTGALQVEVDGIMVDFPNIAEKIMGYWKDFIAAHPCR